MGHRWFQQNSRIISGMLIVHQAANGYLVATLGKLKAARNGTGHPSSLCRRLRVSALSNNHPPPHRMESYMGLTFTCYMWVRYEVVFCKQRDYEMHVFFIINGCVYKTAVLDCSKEAQYWRYLRPKKVYELIYT